MTTWIIIIALTLVGIALVWHEICCNHDAKIRDDLARKLEYEAELDRQILELERKIRERSK